MAYLRDADGASLPERKDGDGLHIDVEPMEW
jgi:hypothetical protein